MSTGSFIGRGKDVDKVSEARGDYRKNRVCVVRNGIDLEDGGFCRLQLSDRSVHGELCWSRFLSWVSEKYWRHGVGDG